MDKDIKKLIRDVKREGFEVRYTSDDHPIIFTADGEYVTKLSTSPGDSCGIRNARARLKRHGYLAA